MQSGQQAGRQLHNRLEHANFRLDDRTVRAAIREMRRVVDGERKSYRAKSPPHFVPNHLDRRSPGHAPSTRDSSSAA